MSRWPKDQSRHADDFYETPFEPVGAIAEILAERYGVGEWLEPCAGNGAIVRHLRHAGAFGTQYCRWSFCELRLRELLKFEAEQHQTLVVACPQNYLTWKVPPGTYDVAITNPPYNIAEPIIRKMRRDARVAIALTRLNFLGGQDRAKWMVGDEPDVYVLSQRPSFTDGGTDATEYAWMVWERDRQRAAEVRVLPPVLDADLPDIVREERAAEQADKRLMGKMKKQASVQPDPNIAAWDEDLQDG